MRYQAILLVSFGGPEQPEDVIPFLENVLRGRRVPRERMLEVAEHYYHFGGRSPINHHCRRLLAALQRELPVPVYWGNRNWHPMLADTLRRMAADGVERALAIATSAYPSYSGCRQYVENLESARAEVGAAAPLVDKLPPFSHHPLFVEAVTDRVRAAQNQLPGARLVFTAHSIPLSMASTCQYQEQLTGTARAVSTNLGRDAWDLVWQSRSGPPTQPWLEPDILSHLRNLAANGIKDVIAAPIGFLSDHMEVLYDLDVEAAALCRDLSVNFVRAETVGAHPLFIRMLAELVSDRLSGAATGLCTPDCCPAPKPPAGVVESRR